MLTAPHISQKLQCDARIGRAHPNLNCGSGRSRTDMEIAHRLGLLNLPNPRIRRRLGESEVPHLQILQFSILPHHHPPVVTPNGHLWWPSTPYSCISAFVPRPHSFGLTYSHSLPSRLLIDSNNTPERLPLALCAARLPRFYRQSTPSNIMAMQ